MESFENCILKSCTAGAVIEENKSDTYIVVTWKLDAFYLQL